MAYFQYGETEIKALKKADKTLGKAIDRIGKVNRTVTPDPFAALVNSIVSQQISAKSAETVWNRLLTLANGVTPSSVHALSLEDIQKCGMSMRKAGYIRGIAESAFSGEIDFENLHTLPDDDIIKMLTNLAGVGEWTVEMLLIFSLQRPNVMSYKDLAIRRGLMNLYGLTALSKKEFAQYKQRYEPYATVASLYIWELSHENRN